jgi:hypothetical protein
VLGCVKQECRSNDDSRDDSDLGSSLHAEQITVRVFLNEALPGQWIGRGGQHPLSPLSWPARSPDLTTPDNSLWGITEDRVAQRHCNNNAELRAAITDALTSLTPQIVRKMSAQIRWTH